MPELKNAFFAGGGDLPAELLEQLITTSPGAGVGDTLHNLGWDGSPVATVCLTTSTDGARVANGAFAIWGRLSEETITFPASKLWEGTARGTTLNIRNLTGQSFRFSGGQLHSEHLDHTALDCNFSRGAQPILPADWAENNVGEFTLRVVAHLDKTSNKCANPRIKFTVLANPGSADQLANMSERTQHVAWPGIKILEGQVQLFPLGTETQWGCPLLPLICTRDRAEGVNAFPSGQHLRFTIAEVMRTAALPTACTARGALLEKGQETLDGEEEPEARAPTVTWPAAERPPIDQGNLLLLIEARRDLKARGQRPEAIAQRNASKYNSLTENS